eukprot:5198802-Prymnesium_polylepis.1
MPYAGCGGASAAADARVCAGATTGGSCATEWPGQRRSRPGKGRWPGQGRWQGRRRPGKADVQILHKRKVPERR